MNYSERIDKILEEIKPEVEAMTLEIHDNPELGLQEYKACGLQTELLKKYGFQVEEKFCGFDTAYKAVYKGKKEGPRIAMLAEYDALPNIGHACGHNMIAMVAVGAGIAMREFADELGGEICVIGTPAEETVGCKAPMADAGAFDDLDAAMMSHPMHVDMESPNTLAIKSVKFRFYGKTAHAAGMPEDGINALDGVLNLFNMINALRQEVKSDVRIHGIITHGGEAPNIIPDFAEAFFFVRAAKIDYLETVFEKVCNCAKGAALGCGARLEIELTDGQFCDTNSNKVLTWLNTKNMEDVVGVSLLRAPEAPVSGSTDMGNASYRVPAIQTLFGVTEGKYVAGHTVEFAEAAKSEYGLMKAWKCIKGHVLTAVDLMSDPKLVEEVKAEFEPNSRRPKTDD